ncbi:MAG TPA: hypothetical protein VFO44_07600 [Steroidobacteraceae bacterium]|nr:hypothetical protein [Steroidobacteraceae bacterium]
MFSRLHTLNALRRALLAACLALASFGAHAQQGGNTPAPNLGDALGGFLNSMGAAMGGSQPVAPVDFHALTALLPASLPGMKRTNGGGSNSQGMGVKTAKAHAEYHGGGSQSIQINITDLTGIAGVMGMADAMPKDSDSESDSGYEKDVTVGGRSMHEKYTKEGQQGSLQVIVAKRFEVDVDGSGVSMDAVHAAMAQVDLAKLEAMKSQSAPTQAAKK